MFLLPAVYESSATLLIEQMSMPAELTGGAGAQDYVEQRLQRTRQRVLTDENVKSMIDRFGSIESGSESEELEDKLAAFNAKRTDHAASHRGHRPEIDARGRADIRIQRRASGIPSPEVAQKIASELANLFVSSSAAQAVEDAKREIEFAKAESERLASELREREARLAKFRQEHPSGLPDDRVRNQERAMQYERDRAMVDSDLRAARARQELYTAQLRDTPRDSAVLDETGQLVLRGADRLAAAQQELVAARAKYSDDHPDVKRLRREIAQLTAEASAGSTNAPTNPAYIQLQSQANAAAIEVRELTARRAEISAQLAGAQGASRCRPASRSSTPISCATTRSSSPSTSRCERSRRRRSCGARSPEAPPQKPTCSSIRRRIPEDPVQPDRLALMFLGIVLAIAAGLGTAFLLNAADSTDTRQRGRRHAGRRGAFRAYSGDPQPVPNCAADASWTLRWPEAWP